MDKKIVFRTTIRIITPQENIKTIKLQNKKTNINKNNNKKKRCPNGTRKHKKTNICVKKQNRKRCPNGTRKQHKKQNKCLPKKIKV